MKKLFHISNHHPEICLITKLPKKKTKQKCLNFGPKTPYLGILAQEFLKAVMIFEMLRFGTKNTFLDIAGLELQKTIVIFEISTLKLVKLENFAKKQNCLSLGPKNILPGYVCYRILKNYFHI